MAIHVTRASLFHAFQPGLTPAAIAEPGEEIIFDTYDCFQGQINKNSDLVTQLNWDTTNPATGPVYVQGAKPGDILRLDILDVDVEENSVMVTIPGEGALGDVITEMETVILRKEGNELVYKDKVRIPLGIMIGVIGVAPAEGVIANGVPGFHGGNMDCTVIGKGTRLYLTVQVEGGMIGVGDLHAAMGDGEIVVVGAEVSGIVHLKPDLVSMPGLPTPFLETEDAVMTICSDPDLDQAADMAIHNMASFLTNFAGFSMNDAGMLMSAAGDLKICQVVDPAKTARFEFPKQVLAQMGYTLPT
ncbi:MAG: acetamidase/formamidase family protein [Anaerolineales bacterium]|nr:acetamidase/formamidase family protein [Anaerolineales bacterium]